jgi:cobalt/nickel transport system ATP-binding protein
MSLFRLTGLAFAYPGRPPVLKDADLTLAPGERVALLGANGAGKTTLLHLMVGLLRPQAGIVEAFGEARRGERDFQPVRGRAGLLFQDPDDQLFCATVLEDVAFGPLNLGHSPAEARRKSLEALSRLGLAGYENRVTHRLSGGEKRMVSLAAVLAMDPEVLLLDEPSNALDDGARERLIETLAGLPQAMVIVSHDRGLVERLATRRVWVREGRVA